MHFKVIKEEFSNALKLVSSVCLSKSSSFSMTEKCRINVLDDGISILGTDLKVSIMVDVKCSTCETGSIAVDCKRLLGIIETLPKNSDVALRSQGYSLEIRCNGFNSEIPTEPIDEMPSIFIDKASAKTEVPARFILDGIRSVKHSMSTDCSIPEYCGMYLFMSKENGLSIYATDGHRCARYAAKECFEHVVGHLILPGAGVIIPALGVQCIENIASIPHDYYEDEEIDDVEDWMYLGIDSKFLTVCKDAVAVSVILLDGKFPDFESLFQMNTKSSTALKLDTRNTIDALKRAKAVIKEKSIRPVTLDISCRYEIKIKAITDRGVCSETIPAEVDKDIDPIVIGINPDYVINALKICNTSTCEMIVTDEDSPVFFQRIDDDSFKEIIMPMQL